MAQRKILELKIKDAKNLYKELSAALVTFKDVPEGSVEFIVEGSVSKPIVGLRYPGRKVKRIREEDSKFIQWANLLDFLVVPYENGEEVRDKFTFDNMFKDFHDNKRDSEEFWKLLEEVYETNALSRDPPKLPGIDSKLYLLVLKWIWVQEDINYKFSWEDVASPVRYALKTKSGNPVSKGAGRAKFYALLLLLRNHHFDLETAKKIIPPYA